MVLVSSVRLTRNGETLASVDIDSIHQVGEEAPNGQGCRLDDQVAPASGWSQSPMTDVECVFGRLRNDPAEQVVVLDVSGCDHPQLLIAVPLDAGGALKPCCYHWFGVPTASDAVILTRVTTELEPGRWRPLLVADLPDPTAAYAGPFVTANWPSISMEG